MFHTGAKQWIKAFIEAYCYFVGLQDTKQLEHKMQFPNMTVKTKGVARTGRKAGS